METNRVNMRDLLSHGLYLMMQEKPFDKITIKSICDKTGVIRGTFYNHFIDKYECLEYLTYQMLIDPSSIDKNKKQEVFIDILYAVNKHKQFFSECFKIQGQNSFNSMLEHIFTELLINKLPDLKDNNQNIVVSKKYLSKYLSNAIVFILEEWIVQNPSRTVEEMIRIHEELSSYSIMKISNINK